MYITIYFRTLILAYTDVCMREDIFSLHMYVAIASLYSPGQGVTDCKHKKDENSKVKEKDLAYVTGSNESDALILFLAGSSESWVIGAGASFYATSRHEIFQNYMKEDLEKVYLEDDEL